MIRRFSSSILFLLLTQGPLSAQDRYFLLMFASQQIPRNPNYSHTFATFVKANCQTRELEAQTISWLPAKMPVRLQALLPETGRNYGLLETLRVAQESQQRVSLWGPYGIEPELYQQAVKQIELLEGGSVRYKANDGLYRTNRVSNCIHAVSSVARSPRLHVLSPGWGDTASHFVLEEMMPWVVNRMQTHDWVAKALGLDAHPIAYRKAFDRPLVRPVTGVRLFLNDGLPEPTYGPPQQRGR